jgi:putative tricarboxylic transport membrane protein
LTLKGFAGLLGARVTIHGAATRAECVRRHARENAKLPGVTMSEGATTGAVRQGDGGLPYSQRVALVLFAIALSGPVIGMFAGKSPGIASRFLEGWYSLPIAIFGVISLAMPLRNPKDYFGGILLIALALFAFWASNDLPGMRGFAFGPGTAPRMFAWALMLVGIAVAAIGLFTDGPPEEPFAFSGPFGGSVLIIALIPITYYSARIGHLVPGVPPDIIVAALGLVVVLALAFFLMRFVPRGPLFITAATLIFAVTVRPLGLVIGSFVSLVVSAYATEEIRWIETLIWTAVLTLFCSLLFPYGLNLPLQLWPRF